MTQIGNEVSPRPTVILLLVFRDASLSLPPPDPRRTMLIFGRVCRDPEGAETRRMLSGFSGLSPHPLEAQGLVAAYAGFHVTPLTTCVNVLSFA